MRTITHEIREREAKKWLKEKGACREGMHWFNAQDERDAATVLRTLAEEDHADWANWTITKMMNKKQCVMHAVFAAELVVEQFEKNHPDDKRPRKAIEAAKAYIKNPCEKTKDAAAYAAADAADAAYAAADAAHAAAYAAACAAACAAHAAAYAAACAAACAADAAAYAAACAAAC
ncbi:MAG: hypothetical protein ACYTFK_12620, partial [Planctomycetota bacterium]